MLMCYKYELELYELEFFNTSELITEIYCDDCNKNKITNTECKVLYCSNNIYFSKVYNCYNNTSSTNNNINSTNNNNNINNNNNNIKYNEQFLKYLNTHNNNILLDNNDEIKCEIICEENIDCIKKEYNEEEEEENDDDDDGYIDKKVLMFKEEELRKKAFSRPVSPASFKYFDADHDISPHSLIELVDQAANDIFNIKKIIDPAMFDKKNKNLKRKSVDNINIFEYHNKDKHKGPYKSKRQFKKPDRLFIWGRDDKHRYVLTNGKYKFEDKNNEYELLYNGSTELVKCEKHKEKGFSIILCCKDKRSNVESRHDLSCFACRAEAFLSFKKSNKRHKPN